jgi:hypothetical protein
VRSITVQTCLHLGELLWTKYVRSIVCAFPACWWNQKSILFKQNLTGDCIYIGICNHEKPRVEPTTNRTSDVNFNLGDSHYWTGTVLTVVIIITTTIIIIIIIIIIHILYERRKTDVGTKKWNWRICFATMKTEALRSSMSVNTYQTTRHQCPGNSTHHIHLHEDSKSRTIFFSFKPLILQTSEENFLHHVTCSPEAMLQ